MLTRSARFVLALPFLLVGACSTSQQSAFTGSGGSAGSGSPGACHGCVTDQDCGGDARCGQFQGDTYCAPLCNTDGSCAPGTVCQTLSTAEGQQARLCVPVTNVCSGQGSGGTSGAAGATGSGGSNATGGSGGGAGTTSAGGSGGNGGTGATGSGGTGATGSGGTGGLPATCGTLDGPGVTACCKSCSASSSSCQANGCYGGWYCNSQTCKCQAPPAPATCGTGGTGGSGGSGGSSGGTGGGGGSGGTGGTGGSIGGGGAGGSVGQNGGKVDRLGFAVVGDTRPATEDDTAGYPTAVITQIWKDVEAENPRPPLAVSTGDYMFATPWGTESSAQLDTYLTARAVFTGVAFPAMGNHECTGATASNCGSGLADGITNNYTTYLKKMLSPIGQSLPYYSIEVDANDGAWTSKFVFVAANSWSSAQASWLDTQLSKPTTYTFVVRHEGSTATTAPGVTPSGTIMAKHPYTLLIAGHTHTFEYFSSERQMIVGNGGAPLTGSIDYGYVVAWQRSDGAIQLTARDYATKSVIKSFAVKPDGTPTP